MPGPPQRGLTPWRLAPKRGISQSALIVAAVKASLDASGQIDHLTPFVGVIKGAPPRLSEATESPKVVSEMPGHSTVAITLDVYSHVTASMHKEAAKVMDGIFGGRTVGDHRDAAPSYQELIVSLSAVMPW
jgi:hypothetical protein